MGGAIAWRGAGADLDRLHLWAAIVAAASPLIGLFILVAGALGS